LGAAKRTGIVGGDMTIRSKSSFPGVVVGLDPDAITLIAAMTTAPDAARQQLISDHIVALKADGVWALLDIYYIMAAHDEQASRLNWKSPGDFTLVANGTITFTADRGWQGDGSTGYLDTGWIPATHGVNYALNDASFGVYSRTNSNESIVDMGAIESPTARLTHFALRFPVSSGDQAGMINGPLSGGPTVAITNSTGLGAMRRIASNSQRHIRNGVDIGGNTTASTALGQIAFYISARNTTSGTAEFFSTRQYSLAFTGAAMTTAQHGVLYDALQNGYLAAVGAAV
jgi:hypothetical protein